MITRRNAVAGMATVLIGGMARAGAGSWQVLGRRQLDPGGDRERFDLGTGVELARLRLTVEGSSLVVEALQFTLDRCNRIRVPMRCVVAGGASGDIDLPAEIGAVRAVDLDYRFADGGAARVTLLGLPA